MTKYRAKPLYYCQQTKQIIESKQAKQLSKLEQKSLTYFASRHEFNVYRCLLEAGFCSEIQLQPKIEIIPPNTISCYPKGKYWKADFMTIVNSQPAMLVEAKGVITKDFLLILALLELNNQELFSRLWIIFPTVIPNNLPIKRLLKTAMKERILTLKNFREKLSIMNTP